MPVIHNKNKDPLLSTETKPSQYMYRSNIPGPPHFLEYIIHHVISSCLYLMNASKRACDSIVCLYKAHHVYQYWWISKVCGNCEILSKWIASSNYNSAILVNVMNCTDHKIIFLRSTHNEHRIVRHGRNMKYCLWAQSPSNVPLFSLPCCIQLMLYWTDLYGDKLRKCTHLCAASSYDVLIQCNTIH